MHPTLSQCSSKEELAYGSFYLAVWQLKFKKAALYIESNKSFEHYYVATLDKIWLSSKFHSVLSMHTV